jgi:pimeloyl-ACP methyl ester carboxylesterase
MNVKRLRSTRGGRILLRVVFYGVAVFVGLPAAFCHVMTSTVRQPIGPAPAGYEDVQVPSGGLRLRGWLAKGTPERAAVIVVHGFGDSLDSYHDVGEIFRRRGHAVLLIDLRGHGGSEGQGTTLGDHESGDVRAAMAYLRGRALAGHGIVLCGYSLGAVSSLLAAAEEEGVAAVIVESPFDSLRETVAHHGTLLYGIPRWVPLAPLAIAFAEIWKGFDADHVDAVAAARRIRAPLLAVAGGADPRMPERVVRRIYDAHPGPKRIWVVPGANHVEARLSSEYAQRLVGFLEEFGL